MPFPNRTETKKLDDLARNNAGGSFIDLPDGITHYEISNETAGEGVVLVHGFSVPYFVFDPTFDFLTRQGFRSLRFDLYGRGYSDRPATRYDMDLFVSQLDQLLDNLRFSTPVHLVGLSMGGPIASAFTLRHPGRVKSLTLIDPSGVEPISLTPLLKLAKIPLIAELVLGWMGTEFMIRSAARDFFEPKLVDHFIEKYRVQMQYHGFQRALLSTMRNNMLGSFNEIYTALGKLGKPTLLLWGREDTTVPLAHSRLLLAALPNAQFHVVENSGHIPHYEKPEVVNPLLLAFLKGVTKA